MVFIPPEAGNPLLTPFAGAGPALVPANATATGAVAIAPYNVDEIRPLTLTGDVVLTLSSPHAIQRRLFLLLTQDGFGGHAFTYPGNVVWLEGAKPPHPTAANAQCLIALYTTDGTTWLATMLGGPIRIHDDTLHSGPNKVAVGDTPAAGGVFTSRSIEKQIALVAPAAAMFKDDATNGVADLILASAGHCAKPGVAQYVATASGTTTGTRWGTGANVVHYSPLFIPPAGPGGRPQIDELGIIVSTLYTVGSVLLALHACDRYGWPGALLFKSSAAAVAMQTTGYKSQALDRDASNAAAVALIDPGKYWAAILSTNADSTGALQRTNGSVFGVPIVAAPTTVVNFGGLSEASAVFVNPASTTPAQVSNAPIVFAKVH